MEELIISTRMLERYGEDFTAKKYLTNPVMLKIFFPSDFTLPELQIVYEQILGKKLDRRNFRKMILNLDILEDTNYKTNNKMGRPAKLYRFKDSEEVIYE